MKKTIIIWFITFLVPYFAVSQAEKISFFEIEWANDVYFNSDNNFSNGLKIGYTSSSLSKTPIAWISRKPSNEGKTFYRISLTQDIYTPKSLFSIQPIAHDRPYASYTILGNERISFNPTKSRIIRNGVSIGVLGKYSGGKTVQDFVHKILPDTKRPKGWDNQIRSDLAFNYSFELEQRIVQHRWMAANLVLSTSLGTPFTKLEIGNNLIIGNFTGYFNGWQTDRKKWRMHLFVKTRARLRVYDATLQGGLFNRGSLHTISNIKNKSASIESGLAIQHHTCQIKIGQIYRTHDFIEGTSYKWAYIRFQINV